MRPPWAMFTLQDMTDSSQKAHLQLAAALCSLPFVPFPMLRAVRKFVCPEVSEQRFCGSQLVDGLSADGITLDLESCKPLRDRVRILYGNAKGAREQWAIETLRELLDAHSPTLSPLLAVEERILWAWLTTTDDAELRKVCDEHLRNVIGTAIVENRQKIYRWASAASRRLPGECFDSELGWILEQLCRTRQIRFPTIDLPSNTFRDRTLLDAVADTLPDRLLGLYRDGEHLELGPADTRRHVAVPVVDTDPIAVDVATRQSRTTTLWLRQRGTARIPVGRETVTIRDLRGRTYVLPGFVGDEAPETAEARRALDNAVTHQGSGRLVRFEVLRPGKTGYVVSLPDLGCTAFLAESEASLRPGDHGHASIVNVIVEQRRVIVRLPGLSIAETAAERRLPRGVTASEIPRRFQAQVLMLGKHKGVRVGRSVYIQLPDGHPLWWQSPEGFGRIRFPNAAYRTANGWVPQPGAWVDVVVSDEDNHIVLRLDVGSVSQGTEPTTQVKRPRHPRLAVSWPDNEPLRVGQHLELRVASVASFGVYLELPDGRRGLLHVTNMFPKRKQGRFPYRPGDTVRVEIAAIDAENQRIALTQEPIWEPVPLGQEMELVVVETVNFGVFLRLPDGRDGLLHVSEMLPPQPKGNISYQPGDRLRVRVLSDDPVRQRIGFTQKPRER